MVGEFTNHTSAIYVKDLRKSFGGAPVLRNLDLEVGWGEHFVLFGGNGSGKTTLLKTLATLARPDAGIVRVGGWEPRHQGVLLRRSIGVVTHQPLLYDELTGYENLCFYGRMHRVPDLKRRIQYVTAQLGVSRELTAKVRTLSHGMQKRLSLVRALLHDPPILLLDEPDTGLDQGAIELMDTLFTSSDNVSRTVVMTTHNLERGLALGDRVGILSRGQIVYQESVTALDVAGFRRTFLSYMEAA